MVIDQKQKRIDVVYMLRWKIVAIIIFIEFEFSEQIAEFGETRYWNLIRYYSFNLSNYVLAVYGINFIPGWYSNSSFSPCIRFDAIELAV